MQTKTTSREMILQMLWMANAIYEWAKFNQSPAVWAFVGLWRSNNFFWQAPSCPDKNACDSSLLVWHFNFLKDTLGIKTFKINFYLKHQNTSLLDF